MELNFTEEQEAEIKEKLLRMHSQIDRSRKLVVAMTPPEPELEVPPPEDKDVEIWLSTGKWSSFHKTARHLISTGTAKVGL